MYTLVRYEILHYQPTTTMWSEADFPNGYHGPENLHAQPQEDQNADTLHQQPRYITRNQARSRGIAVTDDHIDPRVSMQSARRRARPCEGAGLDDGQASNDEDETALKGVSPVRNTKLRDLLDQRAGPPHGRLTVTSAPEGHETMSRDGRGDWVPMRTHTPDYKDLLAPAAKKTERPFSSKLPEQPDDVNLDTSHGRYLNNLLKRMEDRERATCAKDIQSDTESARSFRMNFTEQPRTRVKLMRPPDDAGNAQEDHNRQIRNEIRRLEGMLDDDAGAMSGSSNDRYAYRRDMRPRRPEYRNLKVPKFDGKNFQSFKVAFLRCAKLMQWSEEEAQTQLVCCCEGVARNVVTSQALDTPVADLLHALELRYGINMSFANVDNKLMDIRRKPGETLHNLYDRVMATARRADYSEMERAYKQRMSFFTALRSDTDLQHYVGRRDKGFPPDIELTLSLALQYEMNYGSKNGAESSSTSARQVSTSQYETDTTQDGASSVNRLQFTSLKSAKDPVIRDLGKQTNEIVELLKKQNKLFSEHIGDANAPKQKGAHAPTTSTPRYKTQKSTKPFNKTGKYNGKKKFPFKKKTQVNQVDDAEDEDDDEDCGEDCVDDRATSACTTPAESDQE